jgi:hypothetical protein
MTHVRVLQLLCQRTYSGRPAKPYKSAIIGGSLNEKLGKNFSVGNSYRCRRVVCRFFRSVLRRIRGIRPAGIHSEGQLTESGMFWSFSMIR